jgi:NOL1/NOP2/fmu family ribosome biogenesis protein
MMEQNEEIEELSRNGALYVGVFHSSGKRPKLQRVIIHAPKAA